MSERTRRPAVFRFDDPAVVAAAPVVVPLAEPTSPPEARTSQTRDVNRTRTISTFPAVDIEPLPPGVGDQVTSATEWSRGAKRVCRYPSQTEGSSR